MERLNTDQKKVFARMMEVYAAALAAPNLAEERTWLPHQDPQHSDLPSDEATAEIRLRTRAAM